MSEFFLELFCEEIPARMQQNALDFLKNAVLDSLSKNELSYTGVKSFVTTRRLGLVVEGMPLTQDDCVEERKGPSITAPEQALNGFLRSVGLTKEELEVRETPKGSFYFANISRKARPIAEILKQSIETILHSFAWPKSMRWGEHKESWVRPLHSIICLFDEQVIPVEFAGIKASNTTAGHRFLAPASFEVSSFKDYKEKIRQAFVIIDSEERKTLILEKARALALEVGQVLNEDEALLNEVVGLAEYPVPLRGEIDASFMEVPQEVLITSMRENQKYFSVLDKEGKLAPYFIVVSNMKAQDDGAKIVAGNQRVLRARLSDAKFFWETDKKTSLLSKAEKLNSRIFHAKLGTIADKIERMRKLLPELVGYIPNADLEKAERAVLLCKADLSTGMVGEFPELQGIMGRYYAQFDGENEDVCQAIAEHYSPLGPSDACPSSPTSIAVALADKIDTLVGFWMIDQKPTGSKDPFALRRAALGVIRLILENKIHLPIFQIFNASRAVYGDSTQSAVQEAMTNQEKRGETGEPTVLVNWSMRQMTSLMQFIAERIKVHMKGVGVRHDYISAVYNLGTKVGYKATDLCRVIARVRALITFLGTEDGKDLLTAYRRAANILRIEEGKDKVSYDGTPETNLFAVPEESRLFDAIGKTVLNSSDKIASDDFEAAMQELATLRPYVDAFFEEVQVNCDDVQLRSNRLRMLSLIVNAMGGVADFSVIEG